MKKLYWVILSFCMFIYCLSCKNGLNDQEELQSVVDRVISHKDSIDKIKLSSYNIKIGDIPLPFDIFDRLYSENVVFDEKLINPVSNYSKYNQSTSKALSLGIYGADLAYAITFDRFQYIGFYLKVTKKTTEDLGLSLPFNENFISKYNENKDNKDSLIKIVFAALKQVDITLQKNETQGSYSEGIARLFIISGWIEGLYITTNSFSKIKNEGSKTTIYENIKNEKNHLVMLIKSLDNLSQIEPYRNLLIELKDIENLFDKMNSQIDSDIVSALIKKINSLRFKIIENII